MEKIPETSNFSRKEKIQRWSKRIALALLVSTSSVNAQDAMSVVTDLIPADQVEHLLNQPPSGAVWLQTKNNLIRWYRNPQTTPNNIRYAVGATMSPFDDWEQVKAQTAQPQSITETDFYTNYLSALGRSDAILLDNVTGQPYQDPTSFKQESGPPKEVPYLETGQQWNVHRFLIEPHFGGPDISISQARQNALFDMYRYFLSQESGDREAATQKTEEFMQEYVDKIIDGDFFAWWQSARSRMAGGVTGDNRYEITSAINPEKILGEVMDYNFEQTGDGVFSRSEVVQALTAYYIEYEKLEKEQAEDSAEKTIFAAEEKIKKEYAGLLLQEPREGYSNLPEGFNSWDPVLQQTYVDQHPEDISTAITSEDIAKDKEFLERFRWAEGPIIVR